MLTKKTKIVFNGGGGNHGYFDLSEEAENLLSKLLPEMDSKDFDYIPRHHPALIKVVETLGFNKAGANHSSLTIIEIEEDCYMITDFNGMEEIETKNSDKWIKI